MSGTSSNWSLMVNVNCKCLTFTLKRRDWGLIRSLHLLEVPGQPLEILHPKLLCLSIVAGAVTFFLSWKDNKHKHGTSKVTQWSDNLIHLRELLLVFSFWDVRSRHPSSGFTADSDLPHQRPRAPGGEVGGQARLCLLWGQHQGHGPAQGLQQPSAAQCRGRGVHSQLGDDGGPAQLQTGEISSLEFIRGGAGPLWRI